MKLDDLKSTISAALDGIRETEESPKTPTNYPNLSPLGLSSAFTSPTQITNALTRTPGPSIQHTPGVPLPCTWIDEFGRLSDILALESFFLLKNLYPTHSDNRNVFIPAADFEFRNPFWVKHLKAVQENAAKHFAARSDNHSAEYTCHIRGLLISRSGSKGDFRNYHGGQAIGFLAVTLPSYFRGGSINVQHNRPPLITCDVAIRSDSDMSPQQDDQPVWSHLFTRAYSLDDESEYASNGFAFIYPANPNRSKYALDSITPIENGFRLLLLYDIQLRPKTPIMDVTGLSPFNWNSSLRSSSPIPLTRSPSPFAADDWSVDLRMQLQIWKQYPLFTPERFIYLLPESTTLSSADQWVDMLCEVADGETITLNKATLVYRVTGRQDSVDSEDRSLWFPETEELTLEAIETLRSSRSTTPVGTPFLRSSNLLVPQSLSSSAASGTPRTPQSLKLRLPGYGSPSRARRTVKKEELLNVDDFDLINLRGESIPSEEHRCEADRGNINGIIEQRFKREALVLVRPKDSKMCSGSPPRE
ncbi:hypothetical protein M407DRAFT_17987 [Tulasnella calospora MUT 4182]|uniref:Uncharacterized protein n=1 Tax=Tulasnella calospora MUT 4182 TaxID=1051891 RepID=A0A0C3QUM4_9AGAM|nr:hypothetical protein M407DRAFT_17987 [Tulasnella calospora MUT 4182]